MEGGCAVGNILIMATSLGLGTVPIGVANLENQGFVLDNSALIKRKKLYFWLFLLDILLMDMKNIYLKNI